MERQDLEAVINSQKGQLSRYESRLKDVVTAYKGLLKEKTALESSLAAFTSGSAKDATDSTTNETQQTSSQPPVATAAFGDGGEGLREQVATLMNSLATLTAEKGRMEASFKTDRKQLREVIAEKEGAIRDLEQQIKGLNYTIKTDLENCKSKLKQDREEECNGQLVMICELQKQLLDERHLNETLEMQLRDLKIQFNQKHSDRRVNEMPQAASELVRQNSELLESSKKENAALSSLLHQFQGEIENLKRQHASAIRNEQKRVLMAEDRSKKLEEVHEERVANLEARLAELSEVVGTYDRLRQQDQDSICKLKDKLSKIAVENVATRRISQESNVERIVEEIGYMKNLLLAENSKLDNPLDLSSLFTVHSVVEENIVPQSTSLEDFRNLERNFDQCLKENEVLKANIQIHKTNTKTLQEKIKVLNANIDDLEVEYKNKLIEHNNTLKVEKVRTQELISALESDFKSKLSQLEQQLKKQRERSLQLLEEKEEEIKSLRTSFDILMHDTSGGQHQQQSQHSNGCDPSADHIDNLPVALSKKINALNSVFKTDANSNPETHHILHYAHELARKEIEITALRTAKNNAEAALRQALHDKIASQEELHDRIAHLEEQIDRLERCKSREGANLEYLKNVVLSFLTSQDADGKRHMINAIAAVLQFSAGEMASIQSVDGAKR